MSAKIHLRAKILRTRGGPAATGVLASIESMDERTAEEWWRLLQNMEEEASRNGERRGAREPWRHF